MKPRKNTILIMLLGLLLVAFAAGIAQTPSQGDQTKKTEACCAMDSCCCNGGSCPMKADGTAGADAKEGSCCCSSDSCKMEMKDGMKNHAGCTSGADACDMKAKHDKKHEGKAACCSAKHKDKDKQKTN